MVWSESSNEPFVAAGLDGSPKPMSRSVTHRPKARISSGRSKFGRVHLFVKAVSEERSWLRFASGPSKCLWPDGAAIDQDKSPWPTNEAARDNNCAGKNGGLARWLVRWLAGYDAGYEKYSKRMDFIIIGHWSATRL